jgi:hypothetical protein
MLTCQSARRKVSAGDPPGALLPLSDHSVRSIILGGGVAAEVMSPEHIRPQAGTR